MHVKRKQEITEHNFCMRNMKRGRNQAIRKRVKIKLSFTTIEIQPLLHINHSPSEQERKKRSKIVPATAFVWFNFNYFLVDRFLYWLLLAVRCALFRIEDSIFFSTTISITLSCILWRCMRCVQHIYFAAFAWTQFRVTMACSSSSTFLIRSQFQFWSFIIVNAVNLLQFQ